nr:CLAVATA3/ESR (CLE)-related protein 46 [Ipomoea batatas]
MKDWVGMMIENGKVEMKAFAGRFTFMNVLVSSQSSTLGNSIKTTDGYVLPTLGKEMIHKKPSGPNPIGNQQPPTRP